MTNGLLLLTLGLIVTPVIAACGRGHRTSGPSWFDLTSHQPTNRAARRRR